MSITYLTIAGKCDGFGAQYQSILSGISFCKYMNYIYVHTPCAIMDHNIDVNAANEFIGIKRDSALDDISCNIVTPLIEEVHFSETPSIYYTDDVLEYVRKCYYSSKKPSGCDVDIAIHIRRGDVRHDNTDTMNRYINNDVYNIIINKLQEKYPVYKITIFSEGKYEDFKKLSLDETCFRLNTDIFETFHSLVSSKVLIMGFSSFSYSAGIISSNIVYHYDAFWHNKLNHWLKISDLIGNVTKP